MSNIRATVRYDGTGFHGWQTQPGERTVQGVLEEALARIAGGCRVVIHGAGRTDAGVHALGQVFNFDWNKTASPGDIRRALSSMLGPEVQVVRVETAPPEFHARKNAIGKRYAYTLVSSREPDPFLARYAWAVPWDLDHEALRRMAARLEGRHDFAGFQARRSKVQSTVRSIHSITFDGAPTIGPCDASGVTRLTFHGDGFLYKMVRNIVGTLVHVARGKLPPERVDDLLASPGPFHGQTAPAHGLALLEVLYDD